MHNIFYFQIVHKLSSNLEYKLIQLKYKIKFTIKLTFIFFTSIENILRMHYGWNQYYRKSHQTIDIHFLRISPLLWVNNFNFDYFFLHFAWLYSKYFNANKKHRILRMKSYQEFLCQTVIVIVCFLIMKKIFRKFYVISFASSLFKHTYFEV